MENVTFGCDERVNGTRTLWVSHGCRGFFLCHGVDIGLCGPPRFELRGGHRFYCSCAEEVDTRRTMNAALRHREEGALSADATAMGAEPLPKAVQLDAAWMEPHLLSMNALSARAQALAGGSAERDLLLSAAPATIPLSTCGSIMVPFGGTLLGEFERHLRSFVVAPRGEGSDRAHVTSTSGEGASVGCGNGSATAGIVADGETQRIAHGYVHEVSVYHPPNASASEAYVSYRQLQHSGLVLRTRIAPMRWDPTQRCFAYRIAVWNGYLEWILGELDLFPRLHLCWLDWRHIHVMTVAERYRSLSDSLLTVRTQSPRPSSPPLDTEQQPALSTDAERGVADAFVERLKELSRGSALVNLDWKPADLLVRGPSRVHTAASPARLSSSTSSSSSSPWGSQAGGYPWEARLSDVYNQGGKLQSVAGIVPGLDASCYLWLNLQLPTTVLACGPLRHTEAARHFVARALQATASHWPRLLRVCQPTRYMDVNASTAFEDTISDDGGLATGQLRVSRAFDVFAKMNLMNRGRPAKGPRELSDLYGSLHVQWGTNRSAVCPRPWDVHYK